MQLVELISKLLGFEEMLNGFRSFFDSNHETIDNIGAASFINAKSHQNSSNGGLTSHTHTYKKALNLIMFPTLWTIEYAK